MLWLGRDVRDLPGECRVTIELDPHLPRADAHRRARRHVLEDVTADGLTARARARSRSPWRRCATRAPAALRGGIPVRIPLLELLGAHELDAGRRRSGAGRRTHERTLGAPLGATGDRTVAVDLRADGPHALVAGTTGAGKSELLQTLIAALALEHPPDRLTFLLVDYKGGAAFKECVGLPHTVGFVTDLDAHLTQRALISLNAELKRREHVLARRGREGPDRPGARASGATRRRSLVIVIDEFATLAKEVPEFVEGVVDVAQRGRSLGVHLVLATQRPGGVVSREHPREHEPADRAARERRRPRART